MSNAKRILKNAGILQESTSQQEKVFKEQLLHVNKTLKEITKLLKTLNTDVVSHENWDNVQVLYKVNDGLQKAWSNLKYRK